MKSQCDTVPELFNGSDKAFKPDKDADALHSYSYALKRDSAKLIRLGYGIARTEGRDYVTLADIESSYRSDDFKSNRQDIDRRKNTLASSARKPSDVYCPLVPDGPSEIAAAPETLEPQKSTPEAAKPTEPTNTNVAALAKATAAFKSRITDQLILSGLNPEDRAEYERSLVSTDPSTSGTGKVRELRPKPTKDSLAQAFNRGT